MRLFRTITAVCAILCSPLFGASLACDLDEYDFSEEAKMVDSRGPQSLPRCEHGNSVGSFYGCPDCARIDTEIKNRIKPLVDEFWAQRGQRDLAWLMLRAYKMGMKHEEYPF